MHTTSPDNAVRAVQRAGAQRPVAATERGAALIVTLLMTTVLAGLAVASAQRTTYDLHENASQRVARTALRVTEAGLAGSVAVGASLQGAFLDYLKTKNGPIGMADVADKFFDMEAGGSFDRSMDAVGKPTFATQLEDETTTNKVPGYETGIFCFRRFRLRTASTIVPNGATMTAQQVIDNGAVVMRASLQLGPVPCGI